MEKETGMGMGMKRLPQTTMGIITPAASLIEEQRITIDRVKEERQLQPLREEQEEKGLLKEESAGSTPPTSGGGGSPTTPSGRGRLVMLRSAPSSRRYTQLSTNSDATVRF